MPNPLSQLLKFLRNTLVALLVLLCVILLSLQLESSQNVYLELLDGTLKSSGIKLKAGKISGFFPFNWQIDRLKIADKQGDWLAIQNLHLNWSFLSLLSKKFEVKTLSAASITLYRLPKLHFSAANVQQQKDQNKDISESFIFPFTIAVNKLKLEKILLAEQLLLALPETHDATKKNFLTFSLFAKTFLDSALDSRVPSTGQIRITQLDYLQQQAIAAIVKKQVKKTRRQKNNKIDENLTIELAFNPQTKQLSLQGNLNLKRSLLDKLDDDLIELPEKLNLTGIKLNTSITQREGMDCWMIDDFSLSSFYGVFNSSGIIDLTGGSVNLKTKTQLKDLSKLTIFLPEHKEITELKGDVKLSTTIKGNWHLPDINYILTGMGIQYNNLYFPSILSKGTIKVRDNVQSSQDILISSKGHFLESGYSQENQLPEFKVNFQASAKYENGHKIVINQFQLDSQLIKIELKGNFDSTEVSGLFVVDSRLKDLSLFPVVAGRKYSGSKTLHADVIVHKNADRIELDLSGQLNKLSGLPDELMVLLGEQPSWTSRIQIYKLDDIELEQFNLKAKELELNAIAKIALGSGKIEANINSDIADLSSLSNALPHSIAGNLHQSIQLSGKLENPQIQLLLHAQKLFYNDYQLGQLDISSELKNSLHSPEGKLQIDMVYEKQILKLQSDFQLKDNLFTLSQLTFQAPESQISGQLQLNLENNLAIGKFAGKIKQLSRLGFLHQQTDLTGDIDFNISMDTEALSDKELNNNSNKMSQLLSYRLSSKKLANNNISLEQLTVDGRIKNLLHDISINSQLDIKKIIYGQKNGQQHTGFLNLTVKGNPEKIQVDFKTATENKESFVILSSIIEQKKNSLNIVLKKLDGLLLKQPLKLLKQTNINIFNQQQLEIAPLQLSFGQSLLNADVKFNREKEQISLNLDVVNFSLDTFSQLNLQQLELSAIQGNADIKLSINGVFNNPDIKLDIAVRQLGMEHAQTKNIPRIDMLLKAKLSDGFVQSQLQVSGLTDEPVNASLRTPLELSLLPYKLDLNNHPGKKLDAKLNADIDLHKLQSWYELDQQLFEGHMITNISVSGSIKKPKISGNISLTRGKYENAQTGTLLHDITLKVKADEKVLRLEEFSATDSEKGKIKGSGKVLIEHDFNPKYQFNLNMDKVKLLRHDDMNMQLSGNIQLHGDIYKGKIGSQITVDQGEFFLPESTGADIPQLHVVEINSKNTDKETQEKQPSSDAYPLELDVSILIPSKFYVRGRGLESEWKGKINISRQASDPLLKGALEIKRGYFNFMSHRFNFRKGNISFVGSIPPQPQLDFEMAAAGKDMTAILVISGEAQKPDIKLKSEPMMPNDEILSRLLFNKDISEISGFEALQLANAVRNLSTGGSGFMDKTREALGVDAIDFNGGEGTGGSVKVGKHISEDVYLEVESGLTSGESQIKVEMDITDHISIESRVDQESNTGVGVNWTFDY